MAPALFFTERTWPMTDRRQHILDAAARLFNQYGPQKTTMADIAREASVGVGSVYLEFPNKDALLLAISERRHAGVLGAIEQAWSSPGSLETRLERALTARLDAFLDCGSVGLHGADLLHCGSCGPVQRAHHAFREAEHTLFVGFLAQGAQEGVFTVSSPERTARALLLAYEAFSPPSVFKRERAPLRECLAELHRLMLRGLLTR